MPICLTNEPDLYQVGGARVRCLLYTEEAKDYRAQEPADAQPEEAQNAS